jgi:hypothetical protein
VRGAALWLLTPHQPLMPLMGHLYLLQLQATLRLALQAVATALTHHLWVSPTASTACSSHQSAMWLPVEQRTLCRKCRRLQLPPCVALGQASLEVAAQSTQHKAWAVMPSWRLPCTRAVGGPRAATVPRGRPQPWRTGNLTQLQPCLLQPSAAAAAGWPRQLVEMPVQAGHHLYR